jgi:hypothetical protein
MRKRALWWVTVSVLLGLAVTAILFLLPHHRALTSESVAQLRQGMGEREVREILGPPGDYSSDPYCFFRPMAGARYVLAWVTDEMAVGVSFDDDGKVVAAVHTGYSNRSPRQRTWFESVSVNARVLIRQIWPSTPPTGPAFTSLSSAHN